MSRFPKVLALAAWLAISACQPPDAGRPALAARAFLQLVAAEAGRPEARASRRSCGEPLPPRPRCARWRYGPSGGSKTRT